MTLKKEWGGVILNAGCHNNCLFCGRIPSPTKLELKKQELNVLKNLIDFKKASIKKIEISGSDPIEYNKIISLIKYIKKNGFNYVQLSTHGRQLSDKKFLKKLIDSGLDKIRIPLYGSQARIHDAVTRAPGSFNETIEGIKDLLNKSKIQVQISCLIVQQNKNDLIELVNLVKKLRINDLYFSIPCISDNNYSYYVPLKKLSPYVQKVFNYGQKISYYIYFLEIPFCVFGKIDESINNTLLPPNLGKYCQPRKEIRTSIKDLPAYRLKNKVEMCKDCKASKICHGFFVNDIKKFGTGDLKPIK